MRGKHPGRCVRRLMCALTVLMLLTVPGAKALTPDYDAYHTGQPAAEDGLFVLDASTAVLTGDALLADGVIRIGESGSVTYAFTAETDCALQLKITCRSMEGKRNDVEYAVLVDGALPFTEAGMLKLRRVWRSAGPITQNNQGDDVVPEQVLVTESAVHRVQDADGLYAAPFLFRFAAGDHTLTLDFARAGVVIEQVRLVPAQTAPTYAEYIAQYSGMSAGLVRYEAELTHRTSSPALAPIYDKSSAATMPSSPVNLKLNTLYREIIMITGTSPDIFQDYNLKNAVPGMVDTLREAADGLYVLADEIESLSGGDNSEASYLRSVAYQLDDVADRPETMKERLDTFKSNLSALASWMLELKDQPLELDCFYLLGTQSKTPSANVPFTEEMGYASAIAVLLFIVMVLFKDAIGKLLGQD